MKNINPYKHIQESEKVLKTLSSEAKTMDNALTRLKELNVLIEMLNSFKEMLSEKYYTDYIDNLLLSRMYYNLLASDEYGEINIIDYVCNLEDDIEKGNQYMKQNIIGYLRGVQLHNSVNKGYIYQDSEDYWEKCINNTLNQVKNRIQWNKRFNKIDKK